MTRVPSMPPSLSPRYPYTLFLLFHCRTSPLTVLAVSGSELLAVVLADNSAPESVTGGVWFQRATRPATRSDIGLAMRRRAVTSWVFLRSTSSCCRFWDSSERIWYWWRKKHNFFYNIYHFLKRKWFSVAFEIPELNGITRHTTGLQSVDHEGILRLKMKIEIKGLWMLPTVWQRKGFSCSLTSPLLQGSQKKDGR